MHTTPSYTKTDAKFLADVSNKENRKVEANNSQKAIIQYFLPTGTDRAALADRNVDSKMDGGNHTTTAVVDKRKRREVEPSPQKNDASMFNAVDDVDEDGGEASILKKLVQSILLP